VKNPKEEISMMEVHDCFSITELVTMEDLGLSEEGKGWRDVLDGVFDADGAVPCQIDGGLKCFGHPIGASGARILVTLIGALRKTGTKRGVASLCIGGGEATAMAIEML
jgi:acetyl-CoA C-acetyltransferase